MNSLNEILIIVAQAGEAAAPSQAEVRNVIDFVLKGGVMMIPIGVCSFVAVAVFIERLISLRRRNIIPPSFLRRLKEEMAAHPDVPARAVEYCRKDGSPVARVFEAGLKRLHSPVEVIERHIEEAGEREAYKMRRYLRVLSVIAAISPLMGLLGTIFGMILAFQTVAISADALGKPEMLAEGIYEAMITTAAGLIVAIPALIAYHWLSARVQRLIMDIDLMTADFVEDLSETPANLKIAADGSRKGRADAGSSGRKGTNHREEEEQISIAAAEPLEPPIAGESQARGSTKGRGKANQP